MALLTVQTVTSTGITKGTPAQITAWAGGDTISANDIGDRGVIAEIANASGGSLDFRVGDPGFTPASNGATNGYTTVTVPTGGQGAVVFIGKNNVDPATNTVKVGASTTNAAFTIRLYRY